MNNNTFVTEHAEVKYIKILESKWEQIKVGIRKNHIVFNIFKR